MTEQWQELRETIIEMRDNDGTGTQQEVCKFLVNYMGVLEKQMVEQKPCDDAISRDAVMKIAKCISKKAMPKYIEKLPSVTQKSGKWVLQPSNKEQGERDFIWWKCSECGHVIYSETEKDRREYHAFCGRCGARMDEPQESEDKE